MRQVRIKFEKVGLAKYISHLDLTRCMARAIKRAKIPLWYTEGFHRHPYMTFSLPLSLGIESVCETMDIRIEQEMTNEDIFERLSSTTPSGINIIKVYESSAKAREIANALYNIKLYMDKDKIDNFYYSANCILSGDTLIAEKMGKKGKRKVLKQVNLIENMKSFEIEKSDDGIILNVVLAAGSSKNVNPQLLIDALKKQIGDDIELAEITRKELLLENGEIFS